MHLRKPSQATTGKAFDCWKEERRDRLLERREEDPTGSSSNVAVCDCCVPSFQPADLKKGAAKAGASEPSIERKELVIIGAGPHALTLVLRLLEPEADLLSDKERHRQADYIQRMRPLSEVRRHVKDLMKGPSATLKSKPPKKKTNRKNSPETTDPLPISLEYFKQNVMVVDQSAMADTNKSNRSSIHGWMTGWVENFEALKIKKLRSPISAHADPYDHRALEFFAAHVSRDDELIPMEHIPKLKGKWDFHGPYNCPSTKVFNDFHSQLIKAYGVQDVVEPGAVNNIRVIQEAQDDALFEVSVVDQDGQQRTVQTPRVVCAAGPVYPKSESLMARMALDPWQLPNRVLQVHEIIPFLRELNARSSSSDDEITNQQSILIVGGGTTSAHLALAVCNCVWCQSVKLIQRSKTTERQFDLANSWMGPGRGKLLENFWALSMQERAAQLKTERGGGTIPVEVVHHLNQACSSNKIVVQEETQIMDVQYDCRKDKLIVEMDDGLPAQSYDMIWLATGFENHIANYQALQKLVSNDLPIDLVNGLPILNPDLSFKAGEAIQEEEPDWKAVARKRLWIMGALAGLELGPDALNLMGARQGAVRVAKAIRADISAAKKTPGLGS